MKKNYMSPAQRIVELDTTELIAQSLTLYSAPEDDEIEDSNEILVKESSSKNLWDDSEW